MMNCKVFSADVAQCHRFEELILNVADSMELPVQVTHVTDAGEIAKWQIKQQPALVINEHLVCAGRIPLDEEIAQILLTQPA
jgi:hypothetical protein